MCVCESVHVGGRLEVVDGTLCIAHPLDATDTTASRVDVHVDPSLSPDTDLLTVATTLMPMGIKAGGECIGNGQPLFRVRTSAHICRPGLLL